MECDICNKDEKGHDDYICASCARNSVYLFRLEVARALLDNEQLTQQISTAVDRSNEAGSSDRKVREVQDAWQEEMYNADRVATKSRIEETQTHMDTLRQDLNRLRQEITKRKRNIELRKKTIDAVNETVPSRRTMSLTTLREVRDKGITSFGNVSSRSANTRAFLCRETATLLRLRQKKKQQKDGTTSDQYSITGLPLPNLAEINNIKCTDLTASLASTAHLLVLVAFYLGIRLPAEVTIPHRDYPLPTINTPAQSYLGHKTAFPGSGSLSMAPSSPFSSKHDIKGPYRPRPLFIGSDDREEKVAQFANRDHTAFNFFIEGISLLAWNIAWLCRTQGFSQGTNSWEDICDIGRNLHQLIFGQPQSPAMLRVMSNREAQKRRNTGSGTATPILDQTNLSFAKLGQTSHLSAHAFLGQASSNEQSRSWKYSKFNTIADALKKLLLTEMNNAEWELLQAQEWDDGGEQFDEAVFIKARANDGRDFDDARSIMTTRTNIEEPILPHNTERDASKAKGTSGWTKVKSRSDG